MRYYKIFTEDKEFLVKINNDNLLNLFHLVDCDSYSKELLSLETYDKSKFLNDFQLSLFINDELYKRYDNENLSWNKVRKNITKEILKIMSSEIMKNEWNLFEEEN